MAVSGKSDAVERIFKQDSDLKKRIYETIQQSPQLSQLFDDIAYYVEDHIKPGLSNAVHDTNEHPAKKRRLENGVENHGPLDTITLGVETLLLRVKDVSFSMPKRTKLHLEIMNSDDMLYIRGIIPTSGAKSVDKLGQVYDHVFKLPVPEKAQKQFNYCLLPSSKHLLDPDSVMEPILWTVNAGPIKNYERGESVEDHDPEMIIDEVLRSVGLPVTEPAKKEFVSATPEAHRKTEKAYHVKAFKGSKDGYLFFLPTGILFGYKKPLLFYSFDVIESTSYTSVLQRTFNLTVSYNISSDGTGDSQEAEFSMLDQADFAGIDAYLKRHDLQDASMAEARKAKSIKKAAGGKATAQATNGDAVEGQVDDRTELEKAQQELDDEEDEQEEDFEPSDDDDGSGSESESENDDAYRRKSKGRDLVKDELGSEAEDVSTDEEDDAENEEEADQEDVEEEEEEDEEESTQAHQKSVATKASSKGSRDSTTLASHSGPASKKASAMPDIGDEDQL